MKARYWVAIAVTLQSLLVAAYLSVFIIFPENLSDDFVQHMAISTDLAIQVTHGTVPPLSQTILYYGVEFYLALAILITKGEPLVVIRYAMGLLVGISPVIIYFATKEFFSSSKLALIASFFWVFCGAYLWFGAVFNSGLYANYFGLLASLLLAGAVLYFERNKVGIRTVAILMSALALAFFSHPSTLVILPSLISMLVYQSIKSKPRRVLNAHSVCLLIILVPSIIGLILFPAIVDVIRGYLTATSGGGGPSLTWLGSFIPIPSLQYALAEIAPPNPFRWDLPAVGLFILLLSFLYQARKEKNPKLWMLFGWFVTALIVSPFNSLAWRFSFIALVPLTLMAPFGLYWLKNWLYIERFDIHRRPIVKFYSPKALGCLSLITFLIFPGVFAGSWTTGVVYDITGNNPQAASDLATYQTLQWLKDNGNGCHLRHITGFFDFSSEPCSYVTATDWRLTYSERLGGPLVHAIHPFLTTPETVASGAGNFSAEYVVVSKVDTIPIHYCVNPGGQLIDIRILNSTKGNSILMGVSMQPRINRTNGPVQFFLDGQPFGRFALYNGRANVTITEMPRGEHQIRVRFGFTGSNTVEVFMGQDRAPVDNGQVGNYCDPWFWQVDDWGGNARIVYQNDWVKIWCISNECYPYS